MRRATVVGSAVVAAVVFASTAGATVTTADVNGTLLVNGQKVFPIVLAKGPPLGGTTPSAADALREVAGAGVNFFKVGPATTPWTSADITDAVQWDRATAAIAAFTWINLSTVSQATPGSPADSLLQQVITTLKGDPSGSAGIGLWRGADEPWWSGIAPSALQFAYCRATGRGDRAWCGGEPSLDGDHVWVTVEAPKGTASDLAPYSAVTDTHGVDDYPVTLAATNPDLHQVGVWTSTMAAATPSHAVWTSLQVCASGSYDATGNFVLPTRLQERYMIYDAIINGARSLAFYGGNNPNCWNGTDTAFGWSWTFWSGVLKGLIQEINAQSPLAPALVNPGSTGILNASDSTAEVISRQGSTATDLWVIASRSGSGSRPVTISGLPSSVTTGTVYTENRSVSVVNGAFTDTFDQWDVHVYHFDAATTNTPAPPVNSQQPTISGLAQVGATLTAANGTWTGFPVPNLTDQWERCDTAGASCADVAGATSQTYAPTAADAGKRLRVRVTGTNSVSSASVESAATDAIAAPASNVSAPTISGTAAVGSTLTGSDGSWSGSPPPALTRQWRRCDAVGSSCIDVANATSAVYTLVQADAGSTLRLRVSGTNGSGSLSADSTATAVVTGSPANVGQPSIAGAASRGQLLTASSGSWSGYPAPSFGYQWRRCDASGGNCADIGGATAATYGVAVGDMGGSLRVVVAGTNASGSAVATSGATAVVTGSPLRSTPPSISGTAATGRTLTASSGTWSGFPVGFVYGYSWYRCDDALGGGCIAIADASASGYVLVQADVGHTVKVRVSASNGVAPDGSADSALTAFVTAPPANTSAPTISGATPVGSTLTAGDGSWTGYPAPTLAYQWRRCDSAGTTCDPIVGATAGTYAIVAADRGSRLRVTVTAVNATGSASADSALVDVAAQSTNAGPVESAVTPPVVAAPSAGGGSGGGVPPDLHVELTSNAATTPPVGTEVVYVVKVSMKNLGSASAVVLDVNLPAGFTVARVDADRGSGCTGAAPSLTCDVAWIVPGVGSTVTIWGTVGQAGPLVASVTATSRFESELLTTLTDNTAVLTIAPAIVKPTEHGPPVLQSVDGALGSRRVSRVGSAAIVKAAVSVDEPATLTIAVANVNGKQLTLLAKSQLGALSTVKSQLRLVYGLASPGTVRLALRVRNAGLQRGRSYRLVVVAVAADGGSARLVIPFRR